MRYDWQLCGKEEKKIINFGCPWELTSNCKDKEESFLQANPGVVPSGQRTQHKGRHASHLSNYVSLNCAYSPCFVLSNKATFLANALSVINQSLNQLTAIGEEVKRVKLMGTSYSK